MGSQIVVSLKRDQNKFQVDLCYGRAVQDSHNMHAAVTQHLPSSREIFSPGALYTGLITCLLLVSVQQGLGHWSISAACPIPTVTKGQQRVSPAGQYRLDVKWMSITAALEAWGCAGRSQGTEINSRSQWEEPLISTKALLQCCTAPALSQASVLCPRRKEAAQGWMGEHWSELLAAAGPCPTAGHCCTKLSPPRLL